jgi:hypothetical protein
VLLHVPHAATGEVRAQAVPLGAGPGVAALKPVRIHALPRRVIGREREGVEFVQLAADLGPVVDLKAEGSKGVVEIVAELRDRVQASQGHQDPRPGRIEASRRPRSCIEQGLLGFGGERVVASPPSTSSVIAFSQVQGGGRLPNALRDGDLEGTKQFLDVLPQALETSADCLPPYARCRHPE